MSLSLRDLDDALSEPGTWRYISQEAATVREQYPAEHPARDVLTRLADVAAEMVVLAGEDPEDDENDQPATAPQLSPDETITYVTALLRAGITGAAVAAQLGRQQASLARYLRRHGRPDLGRAIERKRRIPA